MKTPTAVAQPGGIDLKFEISEPVSAAIQAVAAVIVKGIDKGHERYDRMDDAQRKRLDEVLVRSIERCDQVMEALHRLIFKEPKP